TGTPAGGGTYRIRIGTGGGNLVLDNPGTSLGTGTEARLTAPTSASSNKLSVYGWDSPSNFAYVKLKLRTTSTGNGIFSFNLARSIAGSSNNNISGDLSQSLSVVRFIYSAGVLSVARRDGSNYVDVTGSGLAKDTNNDVEIYGNNSGSATYYHRDGANYNLDAQSWDLWVDGVKVSPASGWPRSGTTAISNLEAIVFYGESSAGNAAELIIDDLEYSNALPADPNTIYFHDFGTVTGSFSHPYTVTPSMLEPNLSNSSWSNNLSTWSNIAGVEGRAISRAVNTGTHTFELDVDVANGYQVQVTD